MSWFAQYQLQARYNQWFNEKIYAAAGTLTDEERKQDRGAFFKSIHRTFNHLVLTDSAWLVRFTGDQRFFPRDAKGRIIPLTGLGQELYASFDELRSHRARLDDEILAYTASLTEAELLRDMEYRTSTGQPYKHPLWMALTHLFNHQTHHRGQVTALLNQFQVDVGVTDLIAFARNELPA
ncbi:MAG TPA: DinB family protein [Polyangiales bacterium]